MYDQLPGKLKSQGLFCNWRREERNNRMTKVPYQANGKRANPTDPECFTNFDAVCAVREEYDGIGIGVFGDLFAIDMDHCVADGVVSEMAQDIIDTMNCYTEYSPSGTGIRIIGLASDLDYDKARYYINNHKLGLKVYVAGYTNKFVTLTGNVIRESDLVDRSEELMTVLEKYMVKPVQLQLVKREVPGSYLSDESVIAKALASKQGEKFRSLWEGNLPEGMSHSEADLSLYTMLAFWCGGDTDQMDRLFQESGLMREKWNREDYRTATLERAVAMTTEFYKPLAISDARSDFSVPALFLNEVHPENNDCYPWTDIGRGRLFADCYRDVARFVPEKKTWYCYQDGVWKADVSSLRTMELCKELADALLVYALSIQNERQRTEYIKYCSDKWQIRRTRETILKDAQSIHTISIQEFDSDPYVFNCSNGTLHLDTMEFTPHDPEDCLTKISPVNYDPNFLTKTMKVNEGEVPQYYVEDSHPAIIKPEEWEAVQAEMEQRRSKGRRHDCSSPFSGKIFCGDCGGVYGSKTWHSTDKYRRVIWQCNHKYDSGEKCGTPHLREEVLKERFLEALVRYMDDPDERIEGLRYVQKAMTDTTFVDADLEEAGQKMELLSCMIRNCIMLNASAAVDEREYQQQYAELTRQYEEQKERYEALQNRRKQMNETAIIFGGMLFELWELDEIPVTFKESLWHTLVAHATVYADERIVFCFKDGTEVTTML